VIKESAAPAGYDTSSSKKARAGGSRHPPGLKSYQP
jgi:hypothetical protein